MKNEELIQKLSGLLEEAGVSNYLVVVQNPENPFLFTKGFAASEKHIQKLIKNSAEAVEKLSAEHTKHKNGGQ